VAVRVEFRRPASKGWLGLVHDVQELAPNPHCRRSGGASRHQGRFLFLCTRSNQFYGAPAPSIRGVSTEQNIDLEGY
jgi:hypothetical protein